MHCAYRSQRSLASAGTVHRETVLCRCPQALQTNVAVRRHLIVVAGEARSANRTKWTREDAQQLHGSGNAGRALEQSVYATQLLQDAGAIHDLVRTVKALGQ